MLVKQLLTNGGDYERSLKQRRWTAVVMLPIGLVGITCWEILVPGSNLSDRVQTFYLGAAYGITAGALTLLIRTQYLITHPKAQRRAKIEETDERKIYIARTAAQSAGAITLAGAMAGLFVALPLSMDAYYTLVCVILLYMASFLLLPLWLSKKL